MNRGSVDSAHAGPGRGELASMRPRFMNRGSTQGPTTSGYVYAGFNEAPIHESGKSHHRASGGRGRRRFNEAPIHESGK